MLRPHAVRPPQAVSRSLLRHRRAGGTRQNAVHFATQCLSCTQNFRPKKAAKSLHVQTFLIVVMPKTRRNTQAISADLINEAVFLVNSH